MTRVVNLTRFFVVTLAIVLALAFNAAAYVAQVVYVFLPGSRVTGSAPMHWLASTHPTAHLDLLTVVCVAASGLFVLGCMVRYRK